MRQTRLLGIDIPVESKKIVLEKIRKYIDHPTHWMHIVSLNPENLVLSTTNEKFKKVLQDGPIKILDGTGVVLAAQVLHIEAGERLTGVDLMEELVRIASQLSLRVLLIGGKANLALSLSKCYSHAYPKGKFKGVEGIQNIKNPLSSEEEVLFSIVASYKPHLVFVAFGSPAQELWLDRHSNRFTGMVCMGVGGAFDYLGGKISRPPSFVRKIGLEWFFRLLREPWRWRRQLRLFRFVQLIVQQKFSFPLASP